MVMTSMTTLAWRGCGAGKHGRARTIGAAHVEVVLQRGAREEAHPGLHEGLPLLQVGGAGLLQHVASEVGHEGVLAVQKARPLLPAGESALWLAMVQADRQAREGPGTAYEPMALMSKALAFSLISEPIDAVQREGSERFLGGAEQLRRHTCCPPAGG